MHNLDFSKDFLKWVLNYLSDRVQFVQIDDKTSTNMTIDFGIPQGILGPMICNLYVADLQDNINHQVLTCFQYADDTTLYKHCKYVDLQQCEEEMNTTLTQLTDRPV